MSDFDYRAAQETVTRVAQQLGLEPVERGITIAGIDGKYELCQIITRMMERFEDIERRIER